MSLLTRKDIETVVSRACGTNLQVLNYSLEPFTKLNNGVLGTHQCLTVNIKDDSKPNDIRVHTFFVKSPPQSAIIQDLIMDDSLFENEVVFYKKIYPYMIERYRGEKWIAQCYLVKDKVLVFEDLRIQGYAIRSDMNLGDETLKAAVSSLARFHASALLAEENLGKTIKEACSNAFEEIMYDESSKFGRGTFVGFDTIVTMAEIFGLNSSVVQPAYDRIYELVRGKESVCNVICHCDLWKNNLMFSNNFPLQCILVDFQLLRYCSPAVDLGMILYLHTTPEYRRKSEVDLFRYYYTHFKNALVTSDYKGEILSYEVMLEDYMKHRIVAMAYAMLYLPGLLLKKEDLQELMNNPTMLKEWFCLNRFQFIKKNLDEDPAYKQLMIDITAEMIEEAERIVQSNKGKRD